MPDIALRMSREDAENCLDEIRLGTLNVKAKLLELYEGRGWESLGYPSWRECIQSELQIGKSQAYRLLDAAYVSQEISPIGENVSESHARELAKAPQGKRAETLEKAKESAAAQGRAKPTARDIREAVEQGNGTTPTHDATHQDDAEPRMAETDGDEGQQGEGDEGQVSRFDVSRNSQTAQRQHVDGWRSISKIGDSEHSRRATSNCPHGGDHKTVREGGETYCAKCFEPLAEAEAEDEDTYDTSSLDDFCQWTIDQCKPYFREQLADRLQHWANKARGVK